jgi:hypothetical protein
MTNSLDNAITRIQAIATSMTDLSIKSAPDYPIENASALPMVVSYLGGGTFQATNASVHHNFPVISCEFHVSRVSLQQAYQQINAIAIEFPRHLAGDPTLNGTVDTIVFGNDSQISYTVRPFAFGQVTTQMIVFSIPVKLLKAPL